jgi:hypothetical protein
MQYTDIGKQINISSIAYLQVVLGTHVVYRKLTELLRQMETLANIIGWDKIKPDFDAWLQKENACIDISTNISNDD